MTESGIEGVDRGAEAGIERGREGGIERGIEREENGTERVRRGVRDAERALHMKTTSAAHRLLRKGTRMYRGSRSGICTLEGRRVGVWKEIDHRMRRDRLAEVVGGEEVAVALHLREEDGKAGVEVGEVNTWRGAFSFFVPRVLYMLKYALQSTPTARSHDHERLASLTESTIP